MSSPLDKKALIEAALYAAGRPLAVEDLERVSKAGGKAEAESLLADLIREYKERETALEIVEASRGRYALQLKPQYSSRVSRLSPGGLLGFGTLKTLALIALRQPIRQSEVIGIRGAHSYEHIHRLDGLGFIRKEPSGRSVTLTTTKMFAEYFGFDEDLAKLKVQLHRRLVKIGAKEEGETSVQMLEEEETETPNQGDL
ncbi:MAG: SMC-Scp complex subunit ScpB [Promethearchaeati archaeon SRVP18_Atabeyarchaeia-1]